MYPSRRNNLSFSFPVCLTLVSLWGKTGGGIGQEVSTPTWEKTFSLSREGDTTEKNINLEAQAVNSLSYDHKTLNMSKSLG